MIDEAHLGRQTDGDAALQAELLGLFLDQLSGLRAALAGGPATSTASPTDLPAILHRIRGAAAAVGADGLARALERAERGLDADPGGSAVLDSLRAELDAAAPALAELIAARSPAGLAKGGESR